MKRFVNQAILVAMLAILMPALPSVASAQSTPAQSQASDQIRASEQAAADAARAQSDQMRSQAIEQARSVESRTGDAQQQQIQSNQQAREQSASGRQQAIEQARQAQQAGGDARAQGIAAADQARSQANDSRGQTVQSIREQEQAYGQAQQQQTQANQQARSQQSDSRAQTVQQAREQQQAVGQTRQQAADAAAQARSQSNDARIQSIQQIREQEQAYGDVQQQQIQARGVTRDQQADIRAQQVQNAQDIQAATRDERAQDLLRNQETRATNYTQRQGDIREYRETEADKRDNRELRRDLQREAGTLLTREVEGRMRLQNRQFNTEQSIQNFAQDRYMAEDQRSQMEDYRAGLAEIEKGKRDAELAVTKAEREANNAERQQRIEREKQGLATRDAQRDARNTGRDASIALNTSPEKLSDAIENFGMNLTSFPSLFYIMSFVCGVFFMAMGLVKANKTVMNPSQNPLSDAVKYIVAGVFLSSLPMTTGTLMKSIGFRENSGLGNFDYTQTGGAAASGAQGLDTFMVRLVSDITEPLLQVTALFAFAAGVFLIFTGLKRLVKGANEGPKGPAGLGTIMTFVVGSALIAFAPTLGLVMSTVFGSADVKTYLVMSNVQTALGVDAAAMAHSTAVFSALLAFLSIIGVISFARGLFMMRDVADGGQNASLMGSVSHMIAGVCCVNFGAFANLLQNTLGLQQFGIVFQ